MSNLAPIDDINLKIFDEILEERFDSINLDCLLIVVIENVPSDVLPHLAEQYHITGNEGWIQALKDSEKRNLIKHSIKMHRYKGTKFALEEIFKILDTEGNVEEWFEYKGKPYHFKISLDVSQKSLEENSINLLLLLIDEYKNVRSKLEKLNIYLTSLLNEKIYTTAIFAEKIEIPAGENV